jgi:hypothetical protein
MRAREEALVDACARALLPSFPHWGDLLGRVRPVSLTALDGGPLPSDWAIPIEDGEVVVALAPLGGDFVGVAALVARAADLPAVDLDGTDGESISTALADALVAELGA